MRPLALLVLLTLTAVTLFVPSFTHQALAFGFAVDTGNDAADASPGDGICASAGGDCTLRAAVMEANALPGADSIFLYEGTHLLSIPGRDENAAATGDLDITSDVTIRGVGAESAVDGGSIDRVFDIRPGAHVTLRAVRISYGDAGENDGGGILNEGTATLDHVGVDGNTSDDGAGIDNQGMLTVVDSIIADNVAHDVGGGIQNYGALSIVHSGIANNDGPYGGGGMNNFGTLTVLLSLVYGNSADSGRGGGINNFGPATIENTTIAMNSSYQAGGGVATATPLVLSNVTIAYNTSTTGAGGLSNASIDGLELWNVLLAKNGDNCDFVAPPRLTYHSLDDGTSCALTGPGDISNLPAGLEAFSNSTYPLAQGSPAVDAGGSSRCPETDQRGAPRPIDGDLNGGEECDIGAFEYGGNPPPTIGLDLDGDADCNGRATSIDAALILQRVAGLVTNLPCGPLADVNGDNRIDSIDAALVLQYVAGLLTHLPP